MGALAAVCTGSQFNTCGVGKCETVGGTQICTECATDGNVPINGTCKSKDDPTVDTAGCKKNGGGSLTTDTVCGQCDEPISSTRADTTALAMPLGRNYALRLWMESVQQPHQDASFLLVPEDGPVHYGV